MLVRGGEPLYRQIARALATDIRTGRLAPGARLPAHRDLAQTLSVTVSTITKAYKEVGRLNLITGRARAGTHVVARAASVAGWSGLGAGGSAVADLSSNSVGTDRFLQELATALPALSASPRFAELQEYPPVAGHPHHRNVFARWLHGRGIHAHGANVVATSGAHEGLAAVLSSLVREGAATLLAEQFAYAPLGPLARTLNLGLVALPADGEGLDPDAAASAFQRVRKPVLFVTPHLNNPTATTLSLERRKALVAAARRDGATIIEDDVFALLAERRLPALAAMAPERVFYVDSFAKCVAPGLRLGIVRAPDSNAAQAVAAAVGLGTRMAPPLYAELCCRWIDDGTMVRIVTAHREALAKRAALARCALRDLQARIPPFGPHVWITLPTAAKEDSVVEAAAQAGVSVVGSRAFRLGVPSSDSIRVTLTAPRSLTALGEALDKLRRVILCMA